MSSENLQHDDNSAFVWRDSRVNGDYVHATYVITTPVDGEQAAFGIAREQSICTTELAEIEMPRDIHDYCAKVVEVEQLPGPAPELAALYVLNTPVYGSKRAVEKQHQFRVVIAYPVCLFGASLTRIWNSVFGEVHRLGFLAAAALVDLQFPASLKRAFVGPKYGISGLREQLAIAQRPLFCRSMRPAGGLDTNAMLQLNELVLSGGFDIIKDDELTYDTPRSRFGDRVRRMVEMKQRVEDRTGERKLYFANVIDDYSSALAMAEQAAEFGADGLMVSTGAQGFSIISEVVQRTGLMVLAHNSCGDALTRAATWGVSDAVMARLQRFCGADLVVSPGPFATPYQDLRAATAFIEACREPLGACAATMPIIQGGKQPEHLGQYIEAVGSTDFMIIAATWVDHHPQGMQAGARAFREAWRKLGIA